MSPATDPAVLTGTGTAPAPQPNASGAATSTDPPRSPAIFLSIFGGGGPSFNLDRSRRQSATDGVPQDPRQHRQGVLVGRQEAVVDGDQHAASAQGLAASDERLHVLQRHHQPLFGQPADLGVEVFRTDAEGIAGSRSGGRVRARIAAPRRWPRFRHCCPARPASSPGLAPAQPPEATACRAAFFTVQRSWLMLTAGMC